MVKNVIQVIVYFHGSKGGDLHVGNSYGDMRQIPSSNQYNFVDVCVSSHKRLVAIDVEGNLHCWESGAYISYFDTMDRYYKKTVKPTIVPSPNK